MTEPQPSPAPAPTSADSAPPVAASAPAPKTVMALRVPPWLVWLALALALAGLGWTYTVVQRLERTQEEMARRTADSLATATAARELALAAEAKYAATAARLGVAELRLSEVALQRSQLEELVLTLSRARDDSLVQDLEASVRFAMQQSQLTGSVQPLISALQGAEQRIERAAQPRLNPVQRAIVRDIERLRAAQLVDGPALAQRLDTLVRQVDRWPLLNQPRWAGVMAPPAAFAAQPAQAQNLPIPAAAATDAPPAAAPPADMQPSVWTQAWDWLGQWQQGASAWVWQQLRQGTSDLLRVSRIDRPEAALLAPEQGVFLRENIRLKLLSARLGVLAREFDSARADVQAVQALLQRYFDTSSPEIKSALQALEQLQTDLQQPTQPRPDDTLAALLVAAAGR